MLLMKRKDEIRKLYQMTTKELVAAANGRLQVVDDLPGHFARSIADEIKAANATGKPARLILPVGPTKQYPLLVDIIRDEQISLHNCYLFFMDEYADDQQRALPSDHPLSFKGLMQQLFFSHLPQHLMVPDEQVIFPDENNISTLAEQIEDVGGIDTCYGGIGIHGHVAFNEPEPGVKESEPRLVQLNEFTITINAVRAPVGGNLEGFFHQAYTIGMKQIGQARRIRLYCRSDGPYNWACTVLRLAVLGQPGDDYPVTHLQGLDLVVTTDRETASRPEVIL